MVFKLNQKVCYRCNKQRMPTDTYSKKTGEPRWQEYRINFLWLWHKLGLVTCEQPLYNNKIFIKYNDNNKEDKQELDRLKEFCPYIVEHMVTNAE